MSAAIQGALRGATVGNKSAFTAGMAALAGLMFGLDIGVISGALKFIGDTFHASDLAKEWIVSSMMIGAALGAIGAGFLSYQLGRKISLILAAILFVAGSLFCASAWSVPSLILARVVLGVAIGIATFTAPLYIAEIAPLEKRGSMVSTYQLMITIGILVAFISDSLLSYSGAWRWMLGASAVPGLLLFMVALVAPESPRWLMKMGRRSDAAIQLQKIRPGVDFKPRLDAIAVSLQQDTGRASWAEVFHQEWRRPLLIGVGLAVFQQITGINAIIYYADQIFASAGFVSQSSQTTVTTWAIGGVNVLATLIAIAFIDHLGRRKLLLAGLLGMGVSLTVGGIAFRFIDAAPSGAAAAGPSGAGIVTLMALVAFIICFAFSMGPVVWTVINEVFPGHIRGRAVAVATAANWGSAFLVSQCFLSIIGLIGNSLTFWLFALFCGLGWVWIYRAVPETKGQSLEQIQQLWKAKGT